MCVAINKQKQQLLIIFFSLNSYELEYLLNKTKYSVFYQEKPLTSKKSKTSLTILSVFDFNEIKNRPQPTKRSSTNQNVR